MELPRRLWRLHTALASAVAVAAFANDCVSGAKSAILNCLVLCTVSLVSLLRYAPYQVRMNRRRHKQVSGFSPKAELARDNNIIVQRSAATHVRTRRLINRFAIAVAYTTATRRQCVYIVVHWVNDCATCQQQPALQVT